MQNIHSLNFLSKAPLWLLMLSILGCGIYNFDFWWHLKTGEFIYTQKTFPVADIYSQPALHAPWENFHVLFQILVYVCYDFAGMKGAYFLKLCCGFGLFMLACYRKEQTRFIHDLWITLALLTVSFRFFLRPECLTMVFMLLYLKILNHPLTLKRIILLSCLQILWANSHSVFYLGPILVSLKGLALLFDRLFKCDSSKNESLWLWFFTFLCLCILNVCTPHGLKGLLFPLQLITKVTYSNDIFKQYILEFQPPDFFGRHYFFSLYCLLSVCSFYIFIKSKNIFFILTNIFTLALAIQAERNILLFVLLNLHCVSQSEFILSKHSVSHKLSILLYTMLSIFQILFAWLFMSNRWYMAEGSIARFGPAWNAVAYPKSLPELLQAVPSKTKIWNTMSLGGFIIYHAPHLKVFYDGRLDVYGSDFFKNYIVSTFDQNVFEDSLKSYQIDLVIINHLLQEADRPLAYLWKHEDWIPYHLDAHVALFVRRHSQVSNALRLTDPPLLETFQSGILQTDPLFESNWNRIKKLLTLPKPHSPDILAVKISKTSNG